MDDFQDKIEEPTATQDDDDRSETAAANPDDLQPQQIFQEIDRLEEQEIKMQEMLKRQGTRKLVRSSASC